MSDEFSWATFIAGGLEGFIAPVVEVAVSAAISALILTYFEVQALGHQYSTYGINFNFDMPLLLSIFAIITIFENFAAGLYGSMGHLIGYCGGVILGLIFFGNVLRGVNTEIGSVMWGIILVIAIGVIVRFYISYKKYMA